MTKDIQRAILRACARFIASKVEPITRSLIDLQAKMVDVAKRSDLDDLQLHIERRLEQPETWLRRELLLPGPQGEPGRDAEPVDIDGIVDAVIAKLMDSERLVTLSDVDVGAAVARYFDENPVRDGRDGKDGEPGAHGEKGETGADGVGVADALIDRAGELVLTMADGRTKSLGVVVGRDGAAGADGRDGLSVADVSRTYDAEAHEVVERWTVAGEAKELRYPAGGIRPGGFWREGMKCHSLQAITHDGALWIAKRDTASKPCLENADDWQLAARKGRDGRDGKDGKPPPGPVQLGGGDGA